MVITCRGSFTSRLSDSLVILMYTRYYRHVGNCCVFSAKTKLDSGENLVKRLYSSTKACRYRKEASSVCYATRVCLSRSHYCLCCQRPPFLYKREQNRNLEFSARGIPISSTVIKRLGLNCYSLQAAGCPLTAQL